MKLKQLEASIKANPIMYCHNLDLEMASIEFEAFSNIESDDNNGYSVKDGVATINIRGFLATKTTHDYTAYGLTGYDIIESYINQANNDVSVDTILLDINSGGGQVNGLNELTDVIGQSDKTINTFVSGGAYSAAYWIASSTNDITATSNSGIGSIGVIVEHHEYSEAIKNDGVKVNVFKSGYWKDLFSSTRKLEDKEIERIQDDVNATAQEFFNHVAYYRDITADEVKALEANTFDAQEALQMGLIDAIASTSKTSNKTSNNHAVNNNSTEYEMELQQALNKIAELELQAKTVIANQTALNSSKDVEIATLKAELKTQTTAQRDADIATLAVATNKEYTDAEKAVFQTMSSDAFAMIKEMASANKPNLPKSLGKTAFSGGIDASFSRLDAAIEKIRLRQMGK